VSEWTRRVGLNEALFRTINEEIEDVNRGFGELTGTMDIVCECAEISCVERIVITPAEYEEVRREPTHFAIVPGHEIPDIERIVARRTGYHIVEKRTGGAAEIAEATDPRDRGQ
jgi:hypothetical protein